MMPRLADLSRRKIVPELLDHASEADAAANLNDLRRLNRYFGGRQTLRAALDGLIEPGTTILDIGAATADHAEALPGVHVVSLDLSERHLRAGSGPRVAADAFRLPFAEQSFDIVTASLFLHHFENEPIVRLLGDLSRVARRAVVINDLERHPLAWRFLPATAWLFGWNDITLHDGPVSVAAGFRPTELEGLFTAAGLGGVTVRRHHPWFRLSAVWKRGVHRAKK